jgi:predicted 3-demethylubiquinone-9 3-methyltransferase (glyoxalase superfamily)
MKDSPKSKIAPCLWFDGKAEEAARFYVSLLPDSRSDAVLPFGVEFTLAGAGYISLNGGPNYQFTPAMSLFVSCADQAEVDRLWDALCDGGSPQRCGWVTDRYGVSWQIVPAALGRMMKDRDPERVRRVTEAMMTMIKLDIHALETAYRGAAA